MFKIHDRLIAAMREIVGMTCLVSSQKAAVQKFSLPVIMFDHADTQHTPLTENGKSLKIDAAFTMTLAVPETPNEEDQSAVMQTWWDLVLDKLTAKFPGFKLTHIATGNIPIAGASPFGTAHLLYITQFRRS